MRLQNIQLDESSMKTIYNPAYAYVLSQLRTMRQVRGLTQAEVAALVGWDQTFVSKIEAGDRRLDVIEILRLCHVLEISWIDLITEAENRLEV
jgi:transcriptional regulator with XRE-family HTH domain